MSTEKIEHEHDNESSEVDVMLDITKYYRCFRAELEKRKITEGVLVYDSEEDDQYEWISYQYASQNDQELDVQVQIDEYRAVLFAGPLCIEVSTVELESEIRDHAIQLVDLIQMFLNGQLAVVLTYREEDDTRQAAELVYTTDTSAQKTIRVVAHYSHTRSSLKAVTLRNQLDYDTLMLENNNLFQPIKINKHEITGRPIDLLSPSPLTRKSYSTYDKNLAVQLLGGENGEAVWELFYRRIDFWIVCLTVGVPALWLIIIIPDSMWWLTPIVGLTTVILIAIITSFLLTRRQAAVESDKMPFTERLERLIDYRIMSAFWALTLIATLFFTPIWTTRENPQMLLSALQVPQLIAPLFVACFGIFVSMVLIKPSSRIRKIIRTAMMTLSYGGVLFCNLVLLYGGEDAAVPSEYTVYIITILPFIVIFWYICDCFRHVRKRKNQW